MAKIVLGMATSHSPMQVLDVADWEARVLDEMKPTNRALFTLDGRQIIYDELKAERGEPYAHLCNPETFRKWSDDAGAAADHLAAELARVAPDVVVVIGDDQRELFSADNTPALAIYYGDEVITHQVDTTKRAAWTRPLWPGYGMDRPRSFPGAPGLARELIERLMDYGLDVGACASVPHPEVHGFGHAFGFLAMRILGTPPVPMLPVLLNTYSPPNVPTASHAYEVGQLLRKAIEASDRDLRVAVIASGGLSHFICEEEHDRKLIAALESHDAGFLRSIPRAALLSGSSEILNWIAAAGALEQLNVSWKQYIPIRRSPAGTGIGLGFMIWS